MIQKIISEGVLYVAEHYSWEATSWWWKTNNISKLIDDGATIEQVSRKVNGGDNGLSERVSAYNEIIEYLNQLGGENN